MSDLQPKGTAIIIGGVERHLLFTLAAVDEIQAYYNAPVSEVIRMLSDDMKIMDTAARILLILVHDEIARNRFFNGSEEQPLEERAMKWMITLDKLTPCVEAILTAYGISLPEEEDEDPNAESRSN